MNQTDTNSEHLMRLDRIYPTGAEEWCCIYCERRIVKQRSPGEQEIVLETGSLINVTSHIKDSVISVELMLALEEVLNQLDMDW